MIVNELKLIVMHNSVLSAFCDYYHIATNHYSVMLLRTWLKTLLHNLSMNGVQLFR